MKILLHFGMTALAVACALGVSLWCELRAGDGA